MAFIFFYILEVILTDYVEKGEMISGLHYPLELK